MKYLTVDGPSASFRRIPETDWPSAVFGLIAFWLGIFQKEMATCLVKSTGVGYHGGGFTRLPHHPSLPSSYLATTLACESNRLDRKSVESNVVLLGEMTKMSSQAPRGGSGSKRDRICGHDSASPKEMLKAFPCSDWVADRLTTGAAWRLKIGGLSCDTAKEMEELVRNQAITNLYFYLDDKGDPNIDGQSPATAAFGPGTPIISICGDRLKKMVRNHLAFKFKESQNADEVAEEAVDITLKLEIDDFRVGIKKVALTKPTKKFNFESTLEELEHRCYLRARERATRLMLRDFKRRRHHEEFSEEAHTRDVRLSLMKPEEVQDIGKVSPAENAQPLDEEDPFNAEGSEMIDLPTLDKLKSFAGQIESKANRFIFEKLLDFWSIDDLVNSKELMEILQAETGRSEDFNILRSVQIRLTFVEKLLAKFIHNIDD